MKPHRTWLFIAISSIALIVVLIIQVNWIVETAKIKEQLFNEKANMIVAKTAEALSADPEACKKMESEVGESEKMKTDSIFTNYMKAYNFEIDYSFAVTKPGSPVALSEKNLKSDVYKKVLEEEVSESGLELNLFVPGRKQFILAEMGNLFITSVILILIVLIMFWRTIASLLKEKRMSEYTTDFLNNMTHEFKTPLTNIALAGKMIIKDSNISQEDKIKHYSEIILEENEKLRLQVEQVLSITALERGEIPIQKEKINFHGLIQDSLKCISVQIENKQGVLLIELDARENFIDGDYTHLTNAFSNLIDNAIKYSPSQPHITIKTYNSAQNLIVVVTDKGIGIDKVYHKKIFDKFFRIPTGDVHDVKGFGLGLAYIKKIIELHGGTIQLQSETGKGATFTLTLPHA